MPRPPAFRAMPRRDASSCAGSCRTSSRPRNSPLPIRGSRSRSPIPACRPSVFRKRLWTPFQRPFAKAWPRARPPSRGAEDSLPDALGAAVRHRPNSRRADAAVPLGQQVAGEARAGAAAVAGPAGRPGPGRDDFAQVPGGRTPFGYKDGISFPQIRGNVQSPIVSPEEPIAAGEFVLGYPGEGGPHGPGADTGRARAQRDVRSDSASCTRVSRRSGNSCATTRGRGSARSFSPPR